LGLFCELSEKQKEIQKIPLLYLNFSPFGYFVIVTKSLSKQATINHFQPFVAVVAIPGVLFIVAVVLFSAVEVTTGSLPKVAMTPVNDPGLEFIGGVDTDALFAT